MEVTDSGYHKVVTVVQLQEIARTQTELCIYNCTVNQEIFMYENIHVLNVHFNGFLTKVFKHKNFVMLKLLCMYY